MLGRKPSLNRSPFSKKFFPPSELPPFPPVLAAADGEPLVDHPPEGRGGWRRVKVLLLSRHVKPLSLSKTAKSAFVGAISPGFEVSFLTNETGGTGRCVPSWKINFTFVCIHSFVLQANPFSAGSQVAKVIRGNSVQTFSAKLADREDKDSWFLRLTYTKKLRKLTTTHSSS